MAIEIKQMVIKTSVGTNNKPTADTELINEGELMKFKNDIIKECLEKFKDYMDRQIQP